MLQSLFNRTRTQPQKTAVQAVNANDLHQRLQKGEDLLLVDVRTPGEYEYDGHIAGSRLLPLSSLTQRLSQLPRDKTIVCVCRSGARSQTACEFLVANGFSNVITLSGGMIDWKRSRLPHQ